MRYKLMINDKSGIASSAAVLRECFSPCSDLDQQKVANWLDNDTSRPLKMVVGKTKANVEVEAIKPL